jgi:hypothetical protein
MFYLTSPHCCHVGIPFDTKLQEIRNTTLEWPLVALILVQSSMKIDLFMQNILVKRRYNEYDEIINQFLKHSVTSRQDHKNGGVIHTCFKEVRIT